MTRRQRLAAYLLGGFGLSMNSLAYFLVPLRAHELGASLTLIGLLLGMKSITETVLSVPTGTLIDRIGPKRAVLIGTAGTALVGVGSVFATAIPVFFLLQIGLGALRPLGWVGGQFYVNSMRGGEHRTEDTGKFSFWANVGQIVTPLLAGSLAATLGNQLAFLAFVVYGVLFFSLMSFLPAIERTPEAANAPKESGLRATLGLLRVRDMQSAMMLSFTRLWITSVWVPFYPLYLVNSGTSEALAGTVISTMAVGATAVSLLARRVSTLGRPPIMTSLALSLGCVGLVVSAVLHVSPWFYLPALLIGLGQGLSLPMLISLVGSSVPPGQRGLALSLRSGVNQASAAGAPIVIAPVIAATGISTGFVLAAAIGVAPLVGVALLERPRPR